MKKQKNVSTLSLILKTLLAMFLGYVILILIAFAIEEIKDSRENSTETLNRCERYYTDRDFDGLADILTLYDTFDDKFDIYWEAINAYQEYMSYLQWHDLALTTDGTYVTAEEANESADRAMQQLESMAASPKAERNSQVINTFLQQARAYKQIQ